LTRGQRSSEHFVDELARDHTQNFFKMVFFPLCTAIKDWTNQRMPRLPDYLDRAVYEGFRSVIQLKLDVITRCVSFDYTLEAGPPGNEQARKGMFLEKPGLVRWPAVQNDKGSGSIYELRAVFASFSSDE
jgi:hypothetical protein